MGGYAFFGRAFEFVANVFADGVVVRFVDEEDDVVGACDVAQVEVLFDLDAGGFSGGGYREGWGGGQDEEGGDDGGELGES